MRHQDRILAGSDVSYGREDTDPAEAAAVHAAWLADWRFLDTADRTHCDDFDGACHGLHLLRAVVGKSYRRNAEEVVWRGLGHDPEAVGPARAPAQACRMNRRAGRADVRDLGR